MERKVLSFPGFSWLYFSLVSTPAELENHLSYQMCIVGHILLYSCKVTQFPDFPRDFIHFSDILYLRYTSLNSPVSERALLRGRVWPYRGLIRRPPAACAVSSGWCPSGLCGPPEPSACLWTSHTPPWLRGETHTHTQTHTRRQTQRN